MIDQNGDLDNPFDTAWRDQLCHGRTNDTFAEHLDAVTGWVSHHYANRCLITGEPMVSHARGTSLILTQLQVDDSTRLAALLFGMEEPLASEELGIGPLLPLHRLPPDVPRLVEGYRQLVRLGEMTRQATFIEKTSGRNAHVRHSHSDDLQELAVQTEMLRKMLLAMAADFRIVLIRLSSRLQTLRWYARAKIEPAPGLARETLELFAPLANRLGIWQFKWELEDLAFRFIEPQIYKTIAHMLEEKRSAREIFVAAAIERLQLALQAAGIAAKVSGRPKHLYSIRNKMQQKQLNFNELYDVRAFRVIVDEPPLCYAVLSVLHQLWTPVLSEFDDYIVRPKPNGYQSLHTVLLDEDSRPFEVQVRTQEMHAFAEFGVAAHWRYKEGKGGTEHLADAAHAQRLAWIRQLLAWKNDVQADATEDQTEDDNIYVLTPQARIIQLPRGSTSLDFAYHVHTDLGHRCRGARVDGQLVTIDAVLKTGQTVEIIAAKAGGPSRDWLRSTQRVYLASGRARAKVRQWFNTLDTQEKIAQGQHLLEKELARLGKSATKLDTLAIHFSFSQTDDLFLAVAKDEFSLRQLDNYFQPLATPDVDAPRWGPRDSHRDSVSRSGKSGVLVVGVDSLMTQLARCCRPAPPDEILGFVTRGRGVSVHRIACTTLAAMCRQHSERIIEVAWGEAISGLYPVDVLVIAQDRPGLLRDISEVYARERINVVGVRTQSQRAQAKMLFTVEVADAAQLAQALDVLREISGVVDTYRR